MTGEVVPTGKPRHLSRGRSETRVPSFRCCREIDDEGRFWFIVSSEANWVAGLSADEPVNLGYTDAEDRTWVSVAGTARILEDKARVDRYREGGDEDR